MSCNCNCSVALPHGAVVKSVVFDCGISQLCSLVFYCYTLSTTKTYFWHVLALHYSKLL